jgi:hypothetical protein
MAITSINALTEPISFMDVAQSTDVKLKTFDEKEFNKKYNKFKADLPKTMGSNSLNSIIKGILSPKKKWQLALYLADQVGLPASKKSTDVFNKLKQGWEKIDEQITVLNKSTDKFKKEKIDNLIEFKNAMKEEVGSVFMDSKTKKAADEFLTAITTKPIADTVEDTVKLTSKVAKDINKQNIPDNVLRYLAFKQGVNIPTGIKANRVMSNKTGLKIQPGHPTRRLSQAEKIRLKKVVTGKAKAAGMEKSYLDYVNKLEKLKEYDPKLPHYDPAIAQKMFSIAHQSLFPTKKGAMSTFKSAKPKGGWHTWGDTLKEKRPDLYNYFKPIAEPPKPKDIEDIVRSGGEQTGLMKLLTGKVKDPETGKWVDKKGTALMRKLFKYKFPGKAGGSKAHPLQKEWRKYLVGKYGDEVIDQNTGKLISELKNPSFITTAQRNQVIHRAIEDDLMKSLMKREELINAYKKGDMTLEEFKPLVNVNKKRIDKINKRMTNLGLETKTFDPFKGQVVSYGEQPISMSRLYSHPRFGFKKLGYNEGGIASIKKLTRPL